MDSHLPERGYDDSRTAQQFQVHRLQINKQEYHRLQLYHLTLPRPRRILWIGTDNDGIYGITTELKQRVHYAPHDSPSSVPSTVFGLYEDSERNLWFGSYTNGLGRLDKKQDSAAICRI